jgi:hypothetical protein
MARRVKGGQKLVQTAKRGLMSKRIKEAREKDRLLQRSRQLQRLRPRKKSDPTFAGGRRGGRPSA